MSVIPVEPSPPLSVAALRYAWQQLAIRAGVRTSEYAEAKSEVLGIPLVYGAPPEHPQTSPALYVIPCAPESWQTLLERPGRSLIWLPPNELAPVGYAPPIMDPMPVLFWGNGYASGRKPFAERRADGSVIIYVDIVATTVFMLSRWEETVRPDRDEHDRFPATASVAFRQGFLERPIVDEYGLILQTWLKALCPDWQPLSRRFSVKFSHDIDHLRHFVSINNALRTLAHDVFKQRDFREFGDNLAAAVLQVVAPSKAPYVQGISQLADISRRHGFEDDAFYFMTAPPGLYQNDYNAASRLVKACIRDLRAQGFEIGLHAGYHTLDNLDRLQEQKATLAALLGQLPKGGRQHYLRFRVPETWRNWEAAGLDYDATLSYATYAGFRCGTCHAFRPFDIEAQRVLGLWEHPLIAMDTTF
ncbi:MAG: polysaccharide deacetylase family protein, partial [Anaerolineae bacterium]|nr:polysaccharide deacetylase family protein [Anaerolineae bacterium]